jgi:[acyl-carrier-protein] S-malonyltransferase
LNAASRKKLLRIWTNSPDLIQNSMKAACLFAGQGTQVLGMTRALSETFPCASSFLERTDEILGFSLSRVMHQGPLQDLNSTENSQPAIFANAAMILEVLEQEFGIPTGSFCSVAAGHSLGEYSALYAAKAIDYATALGIVVGIDQTLRFHVVF